MRLKYIKGKDLVRGTYYFNKDDTAHGEYLWTDLDGTAWFKPIIVSNYHITNGKIGFPNAKELRFILKTLPPMALES